jgi:histidinol-phosphate phosphatase family protein
MTRRAVFLDRDGTINEEVNYLSDISQVKILPKSAEAIKLLNEHGFIIIIITNQSGVARGYFSEKTLKEIHNHLKSELQKDGAAVDAIYFCPHHPDDGCGCRKPTLGLIKKAVEDWNINLTSSFMVGDKLVDVETGKRAGCQTVLVLTGYGEKEAKEMEKSDTHPDHIAKDLYQAALWIIKNKDNEG